MNAVIYWLHMVGIIFFVGGVFVNMLVLTPSLQVLSPPDRGKLMGAFLKRFAPLTWGAIAIVGVTGLLLTNRAIGFSALVSFSTRYGNILLVKIILVAAMILNEAYISLVLGRKIAAFTPPPGAARPPRPAPEGGGSRRLVCLLVRRLARHPSS